MKYERMNSATLERLRDYSIIFSLFRIDNLGKEHCVIRDYQVNNLIEEFEVKVIDVVRLDILKYKEKNDPTTLVTPKNINTVSFTLPVKPIFISKDHSLSDPKNPFKKENVERSLFNRIKEPFPDQAGTYLCGPASFFYCVLTSSPRIYKKIVKELWERGEVKINNLLIKPNKNGARTVSNFYYPNGNTRISVVDWITMASLRDMENSITRYNTAGHDGFIKDKFNGLTAFTMPNEVNKWLLEIGFSVPLYRESLVGTSGMFQWVDILKNLSQYPSKDYYYVLLTSSSVIHGSDSSLNDHLPKFPSHYIVLTSDIISEATGGVIDSSTNTNEYIQAKCFNWGKIDRLRKITLKQFANTIWAIMVVKKELR